MEEIGIDQWAWKMKEHKRKGHKIIEYPERDINKKSSVGPLKHMSVLDESSQDFMGKRLDHRNAGRRMLTRKQQTRYKFFTYPYRQADLDKFN